MAAESILAAGVHVVLTKGFTLDVFIPRTNLLRIRSVGETPDIGHLIINKMSLLVVLIICLTFSSK